MDTDRIKRGETYVITITPQDADGAAIVMDGSWSAAYRITRRHVGGKLINEGEMTIADGVATKALDTGVLALAAGIYVYDVRITDPDGNDFWSEPVELTIEERNTPGS